MNNYRQHLGNELRYSFITTSFIANTWQHCFERQRVGLIRSIAIRDEFTNITAYKYKMNHEIKWKCDWEGCFHFLNFTFPRSSDCLWLHAVKNSEFWFRVAPAGQLQTTIPNTLIWNVCIFEMNPVVNKDVFSDIHFLNVWKVLKRKCADIWKRNETF